MARQKSAVSIRIEELARKFGVSVWTMKRAADAGAPIDDDEKLSDWLAGQRQVSKKAEPDAGKVFTFAELKIEKTKWEIQKIKTQVDEHLGKLIPADKAVRDAVRIGNAIRSELMRIGEDIPNWEGLKAAEMKKRWDALMERLCRDLHDQMCEAYQVELTCPKCQTSLE